MGNAESDLASVSTLKSQLTALETKLTSLSHTHQDHTVYPEKGSIVSFCGARLHCKTDVKILVGPIIGKVTDSTARVLIEVDVETSVTMFVSLVNEDIPNGRVITSITKICPARQPVTIQVDNLSPDSPYVVSFSGVSRECAESRIGQFRTIDLTSNSLRILAVSCDSPEKTLTGEHNMWETLSDRVVRKELPNVDVVIHLGGQVTMKKTFQDGWAILQHNSERTNLQIGEWKKIENDVLERFRAAYRFSWNLPYTKEVLSKCSHLMVCGDRDVYPNFTLDVDLSVDVGGRVVSTLIRLARRAYWEYQRSLWDGQSLEEALSKEDDMVNKVTRIFEAKRRRVGREAALNKAERQMGKIKQLPLQFDEHTVEAAMERIEELKDEVVEAKSKEASAAKDVRNEEKKETSYHVFGDVGVLLLDTRWNRIASDGTQNSNNPLISERQWEAIEMQIEGNSPARALVVCTEFPVVEMDKSATIDAKCIDIDIGGKQKLTDFHSCHSTWALNESQQRRLLELLFGWKKRERHRQVLIMSGGLCHGLNTVIKTRGAGWAIQQITTGPITDIPVVVRCQRSGTVLNSAYEYEHNPLPNQRNYAEAVVTTKYEGSSAIKAQLVGQYFANINCICGPIIGKVTANSAIVLIEVDGEASVTCSVTDVLSGDAVRVTRLLPRREPFAFLFDDLECNRHYVVRFEGFDDSDERVGSFTTWSSAKIREESGDYDLNLVFVSGEVNGTGTATATATALALDTNKDKNKKKNDTIWSIIADASQHPWSGVDAVIHLGGQVDINRGITSATALLLRAEREDMNTSTRKRLIDDAGECLREAYRIAWSLPGTREALANSSNIMLRGSFDFGSLLIGRNLNPKDVNGGVAVLSGTSKRLLRSLVERVFREYQRQLWDPIGVADVPALGCSCSGGGDDDEQKQHQHEEWHFHSWGPLGLFCMDVKSTRLWKSRSGVMESEIPLVSDSQWKSLSDAMASESITTLVVCCEVPFVDDSIGDARFKATDPSHSHLSEHWPYHGSELLRLLNALFEWKSATNGRIVLLVCGGIAVGVDSVIKHKLQSGMTTEIRQITCGPAAAKPETDLWAERVGALNENISYEHLNVKCTHNFGVLRAVSDNKDGVKIKSLGVVTVDEFPAFVGRSGLVRRPWFCAGLHNEKRAKNRKTKSGGNDKSNLTLLTSILESDDVTAGLKRAFATLHSGDSASFDEPVDFSKVATKVLTRFYYNEAPAALRDLALPPNRYTLEACAKLWENGEGAVIGGRGEGEDGDSHFLYTYTKKLNVPLAVMNAESFVGFCREVFRNAVVVKSNLASNTKGGVTG